jgi:exopolyphosphatase / guanosine-5'-triphosphate,3'-diphosphate pyrophosphatase
LSNGSNIPFRDGDLLASVDLGSNSFHMVVARYEHGAPRLIDRLRETIRLAAGLRADGTLDDVHRDAALRCLARFGQRLAGLPADRVRAVATNTVRQLRAPKAFLHAAERALGHAIEVVSGREEARLIWQGVSHSLPANRKRRLVIDVGGGSTEFIIGRGPAPELMESVQIGCVASSLHFFPQGRITRKRWQHAIEEIGVLLQQFAADYRDTGWSEAWGASGTIRAIASLARTIDAGNAGITSASLRRMREALIRGGSAKRAALPGLNDDRLPVIAGGVAIIEAAFATLGIERLDASEGTMREGMLWDMVGRATGRDPRVVSIRALARRYSVDRIQAERVETTAGRLFDAVADIWHLDDYMRNRLLWAARVHEIGLAIAHSQHQRHAGYLLRNSDLAGFSNEERQLLAAIVQNHRRKPDRKLIAALPVRLRESVRHVTALLRLAVILCRTHDDVTPLALECTARGDTLKLTLPATWWRKHPLTVADLELEQTLLGPLGVKLQLAED